MMRVSRLIRPLANDDTQALIAMDEEYSRRTGSEPVVDDGSVSFFSRSGHAFVLEEEGEIEGFLLAQSVWDGRRPAVMVRRLVAGDGKRREALLEALTKSAYDAGVYDIMVEQPEADRDGAESLRNAGYALRPTRIHARVLGSRQQSG